LAKEGIIHDGIFLSGDVMCDTLYLVKDKIQRLFQEPYYFVTLHRPYNTDDGARLQSILTVLNNLDKKVIFPVHPRAVARMKTFGIETGRFHNIHFIEPIGYVESLSYQAYSEAIITDSGGMQKEAYMLQKKCITVRSETEWTETLRNGWNTLVFDDVNEIPLVLKNPCGAHFPDTYGKGNAAKQIVEIIKKNL
jgi:UDP-GlcNAc3NAcA epimerase